MPKIFITGITGQIGSFVADLFLKNGYEVWGGVRRSANFNPWRLEHFGILNKVLLEYMDLADQSSIDGVIKKIKPDLMLNAAAQSFVGSSWEIGEYTLDVTGVGVYRCLESIRKHAPKCRFLQMSSSEMFGDNPEYPYNETSRFQPRSPYGCAKCLGFNLTVNFRESYGIFASNIILFNTESPLRGQEFLTRKVVTEGVRVDNEIKTSKTPTPLCLGNLTPSRDWTWAGDTANAINLILNHNRSDDFCICSGTTNTVRTFCDKTFAALGYEPWWVSNSPLDDAIEMAIDKKTGVILAKSLRSLYRPADVPHLIGNNSKAQKILGWKPTKNLDEIIREMINYEKARRN